MRSICRLVLALSGVRLAAAAFGAASASTNPTIAHSILVIEGETSPDSTAAIQLERMIGRAVATLSAELRGESELERARRFFSSVDRVLIESDVIFPPNGAVDFLRDGLQPRKLNDAEFIHALMQFGNFRRQPEMHANKSTGGSFWFFDCDLAALLYMSVAERLGFPVYSVEVPNHTFVRWESPTVTLNWDPNDGISYPDNYYIRTWYVPTAPGIWPKYLENINRARVLSTWYVLCGRTKKAAGNFRGALADFRHGTEVDPTDLGAINELAWLLATCPTKELRNGSEALTLGRTIVEHGRRAIWLQTLAAAQAEMGDFVGAISTEREVQRVIGTPLGWASPRETLIDPAICLAAYESGRAILPP